MERRRVQLGCPGMLMSCTERRAISLPVDGLTVLVVDMPDDAYPPGNADRDYQETIIKRRCPLIYIHVDDTRHATAPARPARRTASNPSVMQ